jgi:pimeloyl-ACP methyl ester carboxylesterase
MVYKKSHFIQALGREIHVVEQLPDSRQPDPKLPTLYCLHGLTRNASDFETFGNVAAAKGYRVLSVDFPGRGFSEWSPPECAEKEYTQHFYVPCLTEVLRKLGYDVEKKERNTDLSNRCANEVFLIGQSMGGVWSWCATGGTAIKNLISKIILIDIGPELHMPGLIRIGKYTTAANDAATMSELIELYKGRFTTFSKCSDETLVEFVMRHARRLPTGRWALHTDPAAPANLKNDTFDITNKTDDKTKVWGAFSNIECPIVVIRGADSDLLVPEGIEKMRQHCKNGPEQLTAYEVPGVGHVPLFINDEEIALLLKSIE